LDYVVYSGSLDPDRTGPRVVGTAFLGGNRAVVYLGFMRGGVVVIADEPDWGCMEGLLCADLLPYVGKKNSLQPL